MDRPITEFFVDAAGAWSARLSCAHTQPVVHRPPYFRQPWVRTEEGRKSKLGVPLACEACDRLEMPEDLVAYKKTKVFERATIPPGLQRAHTTGRGVWARIHVLEGHLRYFVETPIGIAFDLSSQAPGTVAPEVVHRVEPEGEVRFFLEFLRRF